MKLLFALLFPVILSCSSIAEDKRPDEFPVVSYNNLEVSNFNLKISAAMNNGEKWVYHPLLVIQEYRKIADVSFVSILLSNDSVENPLNSTITVVEEGYLDDSVRGQWLQFHLGRENSESAWKINEIRQAFLCGRMNSPQEFFKELCP
jgi:hypothetical protein